MEKSIRFPSFKCNLFYLQWILKSTWLLFLCDEARLENNFQVIRHHASIFRPLKMKVLKIVN